MLNQKTLAALKKFALEQDNKFPATFVGRKDIIQNIHDLSGLVYREYKNQSFQPAATQLIHGAPGAGKSSLLMHLQKAEAWKDSNNFFGASQPDPSVLYLKGPEEFMDLNLFGHTLQTFLTEGSAGIGSFGKVGRAVEIYNEYYDPIDPIIRDNSIKWNRPLIIAIDEFQNIGRDWNRKASLSSHPYVGVLRKLNDGSYNRPIMLVLGGLCNVPDKFFGFGITRIPYENNHPIGAFKSGLEENDDDETTELIEAWSEKFKVPEGPWKEEILQMAEEGSHWPTYIDDSLRSLSKEIVDVNGEMNRLNLNRVRDNTTQMRMSYFSMRISPELEASKYLLSTVMKKIPFYGYQGSKIDIVDIHDSIIETTSNPPTNSPSWSLPNGIEYAEEYAEHLVNQGLIQMQENHYYICPIPSLRSYILEYYSPSLD